MPFVFYELQSSHNTFSCIAKVHTFSTEFSFLPFVEFGCVFLYILIQLVKVYISQYRADDTPLRCATVSIVELPVFDISRFHKLAYQSDEAFIRNTLQENVYQYIMVYIIKEAFYVSLHKPFCTIKLLLDMS